jgi:hypothetical protein
MKLKMKLKVYRLLYKLTNNKRWVRLYVKTLNEQALWEIAQWRKEHGIPRLSSGE